MNIVIYIVSGVFILLTLGLSLAYYRTRHHGLLLMAAAYGTSASLALFNAHWWPLLVGFALVWMFRFMGYDPDTDRNPR